MALPIRRLLLNATAGKQLEDRLWTDRYTSASIQANGIVMPCKVRYRGGHTRNYPKRSFDIRCNGRTYHYNAEYDDPSMIRNALSFAILPKLGVHAPQCRHIALYRNNVYQGVYLEIESVGRSFFRRRGIRACSLFYAVNNNANYGLYDAKSRHLKSSLLSGYEHKFGGSKEKMRLTAFIRGVNQFTNARQMKDHLIRHLDVDQYLRWLSGAVLTGNYDGFEQNYAVYRHGKSGKYRNIPWDYEGTWGRNCYGLIQDDHLVPVWGYNELTKAVFAIPSWRRQYRRIMMRALSGPFQEQTIMPIVRKLMNSIAAEYRRDPLRRGSYAEFLEEPGVIRRYIRVRRKVIVQGLKQWQAEGNV